MIHVKYMATVWFAFAVMFFIAYIFSKKDRDEYMTWMWIAIACESVLFGIYVVLEKLS